MSKYLKSLITVCLVVCMTVCLGIFAAACNNDPEGDGGENTLPTSVNVTVLLDDDTPAAGVSVQICTVNDDGTANMGKCKLPKATNAQGVAAIDINKNDGNKFEVHILSIPDDYAYYTYVDDNGIPYAEGTGARVDITKSANVTVKLAIPAITDKLSAGNNIVKLDAITDTLEVKANIESAGWYQLTSYTNAFKLSGTGFNLTNENYLVSIYLKPNDELTFNFVESDESELIFGVGLNPLEVDGSEAKPLPAVIGSQYVISLEAEASVYITNDTVKIHAAALDVSGTNFCAVYGEEIHYNEAFTLNAPQYDDNNKLIPETFEVSTAEGDAGVVTLYFAKHEDSGNVGGNEIVIGTQMTISNFTFDSAYYSLVVSEKTSYNVTTDTYVVIESDNFNQSVVGSSSNEVTEKVTLEAGTYTVTVYNDDGAASVTLKIEIKTAE